MPRAQPSSASQVDLAALVAQRLTEALSQHPTVNTQAKLQAASGVRQSTISKILRAGSEPGVATLYALANGLGMPLTALLADVPVVPSKFLSQQDRALAHLAPLPRAFVDVVLQVAAAGALCDADYAKLIGEWGTKLPQPTPATAT